MEAHSANILRKSGRGASREGGYVRAGAGRWERRGPAGSSCSGGAGIGSVRAVGSDEGRRGPSVPAGRASSLRRLRTGRSHPRAERLFRRGPSVPAGPASSRCRFRTGRSHLRTGRRRFRTGRSHPPDARPPIFARSALRKGPDAPFSDTFCPFLQRPAAPEPTPCTNPAFRRSGNVKKLFFYFYFIIKDVSLCSQNNT